MSKIINKIMQLKEEREAIILAHNYQPGEIQDLADYVGDSFGLSRLAAESKARVILFCGVRFMAESAALLAPGREVLLPVKEAGCPMADTITSEDVRRLKKEYPGRPVVAYVNTTAEVKAESDICCTSSNAVQVVNSLSEDELIFVPDKNLAHYVDQQTEKRIIPWEGGCITHHRLKIDDLRRVRELHPEAEILVHPECPPEIVREADFVGGTGDILDYAQQTATKHLFIGTEVGIIHRLNKENPKKSFFLLSPELVCPGMKLTSLEDVFIALRDNKHLIEIDARIQQPAVKTLDRMLAIN